MAMSHSNTVAVAGLFAALVAFESCYIGAVGYHLKRVAPDSEEGWEMESNLARSQFDIRMYYILMVYVATGGLDG